MRFSTISTPLLGAFVALVSADATTSEPPESTIQPSSSAVASSVQTAAALSPVSNVKGAAFDRFFQVWLENTDYDAAARDASQKYALPLPQARLTQR
jgi:acid phosphatase